MLSKRLGLLVLLVGSVPFALGCDSGGGGGASMDQMGGAVEAAKAAEQQAEAKKAEEAKQAEEAAKAAAAQAAANPPKKEARRAEIGEGGYFTAIAGARWHVLNRVEDLAWTQAVQHFQASEGRLPKDNAEFMKVVNELGIDLGYKEEGQEFLYDPAPTEDHPWGNVYVVEAPAQAAPYRHGRSEDSGRGRFVAIDTIVASNH